jgi:hypothetical protein
MDYVAVVVVGPNTDFFTNVHRPACAHGGSVRHVSDIR